MISILGTYIFIYLINKYFNPETLGLFSLAQSILYITSIFVALGFDVLTVKLSSNFSYKSLKTYFNTYKKIVFLVIFVGVFFTIGLINLSFYLSSNIFENPKAYLPIKYFAFCLIPLAILSINSETFRGINKFINYSIYNKTSLQLYASFILIIIINITESRNYMLPHYCFMLAVIIMMLASSFDIISLFSRSNLFIEKKINYSCKELFKKSNSMMVTNIILHAFQWSSIILLGIYSSLLNVAIFTLIMKICSMPSLILTSINGIAAPKIAQLYDKDELSLNILIKNITQLTFVLSFPILLIILFSNSYLLAFFGDEYASGKIALVILLVGQFFNIVSGSVITILNMTNRQIIVRNILIFSLAINILFNMIFIPRYGAVGAAIGTSVGLITCNLVGAYFVYKELKIKSYIRK